MRLDSKKSAFFLLLVVVVSSIPTASGETEDMIIELVSQSYTLEPCGEYHGRVLHARPSWQSCITSKNR
jgi:hypothetical protein